MHPADREEYVARYEARLREFGYSPETLGWGKQGRQEVRFHVLAAPVLAAGDASVLDVGCGFADLYDHLAARGWKGRYRGVDIVPGLLERARERRPELDLRLSDLAECAGGERFDFVVASGVFNARLQGEENPAHIERSLGQMLEVARVAACADFLSIHVDFRHPLAWHTDPAWMAECAARLTRRFQIRHDYMPFEFAAFLYRDQEVSPRRVFGAVEAELAREEGGA